MFLCILSSFTSVLFVLQLLSDIIDVLEASWKRSEIGAKKEQKSQFYAFCLNGVLHPEDGVCHSPNGVRHYHAVRELR